VKYLCDTNFIIRYLVNDNEKMHQETRKIFDEVKTGNISIILEQSVFSEIIFVLSSCYKIDKEDICDKLSILIMFKGIITEKDLLLDVLNVYRSTNLHIVDCILYARTKDKNIPLLSFDKQLLKIARNTKR
jgi:predicted nucleic-acid-binding protein